MTETPIPLATDFARAEIADWHTLVDKILKGGDFERRLVSRTLDGIAIKPLYPRTDRPAPFLPSRRNGFDGWDIRQIQAGTVPEHVNAAILEDLAGGATSVSLQFSCAGRHGLQGTVDALARSLDGVLLDVCPVALDAGEQAFSAAAALVAIWKHRGVAPEQRLGALNADPVGALARAGSLPYTVEDGLRFTRELLAETLELPHVTALNCNGHIYHQAGASEAEELAATLATLIAYLRTAETAGIEPEKAFSKIAVTLAVDADQLMGLAKLRAARRMLARVAEACGAKAAAADVQLAAETSMRMMSRRDPWVNVLRTTMATAVGAWGGADSITVYPFTWPLGQTDSFARRIARNTSIVLAEESGLGRVADPAAGSYAVEALTSDLATAAWTILQQIERDGGIVASLQSGALQNRIGETRTSRQKLIATGKLALTGTSAFPLLGKDGIEVLPWPPAGDTASARSALRIEPLSPMRDTQPFEALRDAADAHEVATGRRPRIFLACLGALVAHSARATWMKNFLAAGGIEGLQSSEITASQDAGRQFAESGAALACLCSSDTDYAELGEATIGVLKAAGAKAVFIAGRPKECAAALESAGAGGFIAAGDDMLTTLAELQRRIFAV